MTALIVIPLYFSKVLYKYREDLLEEDNKKSFGSLYAGKNVDPKREHRVYFYPEVFFYRRLLFICASVYLFEKPAMQMIVHQILTMATLCYLVYDKRMFEQRGQAFIEISSEFLLLFVSLVIQESIREHDEKKLYKIGTGIFVGIGLMTAVNVTYIIYTVIQGCREKRRLKALEKRKKEA